MNLNTLTTSIVINDKDIEIFVDYSFYKGKPERQYLSNGDPGYPAEDDEVEIHFVSDDNGNELTYEYIGEANFRQIETKILEQENTY